MHWPYYGGLEARLPQYGALGLLSALNYYDGMNSFLQRMTRNPQILQRGWRHTYSAHGVTRQRVSWKLEHLAVTVTVFIVPLADFIVITCKYKESVLDPNRAPFLLFQLSWSCFHWQACLRPGPWQNTQVICPFKLSFPLLRKYNCPCCRIRDNICIDGDLGVRVVLA